MKKASTIVGIALVVIVSLVSVPSGISAEVVWTISGQLDLKTPPLDICASADGKWLYILSAGEVAVYSFADGTIVNRIAIDKAFDRMIYVKEKNALVVTGRSGNTVQIIQLDVVYQFALSGLPYKGPKNAPVTIAVFSDYQ
jgi:protein-disulfide isomerase